MLGMVWIRSAEAVVRILWFCSEVSQVVGREVMRDRLKVISRSSVLVLQVRRTLRILEQGIDMIYIVALGE